MSKDLAQELHLANTTFQSGGGSGAMVAYASENISAGGEISSAVSGTQYRPVAGTPGAVTASTTPFGTAISWVTGAIIVLRGTSDSLTVTIPHNDAAGGALLNGVATLEKDFILELVYDLAANRWIEKGRNF